MRTICLGAIGGAILASSASAALIVEEQFIIGTNDHTAAVTIAGTSPDSLVGHEDTDAYSDPGVSADADFIVRDETQVYVGPHGRKLDGAGGILDIFRMAGSGTLTTKNTTTSATTSNSVGSEVWFSVLIDTHGATLSSGESAGVRWDHGEGTNNREFGVGIGAHNELLAYIASTSATGTGLTLLEGVNLIVVRLVDAMTFVDGTGGIDDKIEVFLNPPLTSAPTGVADFRGDQSDPGFSFMLVGGAAGGWGYESLSFTQVLHGHSVRFDEFRLGDTFADVAPVATDDPADDGTATSEDTVLTTVAAAPDVRNPVQDVYLQSSDAAAVNNSQLQVKNDGTTAFSRKAYLRFDVASAADALADAELQLTVSSATGGSSTPGAVWNFNVYGLDDGHPDEAWDSSTFTYNTAPGNSTANGAAIDDTTTTFIGSFDLTTSGTPGEALSVSGAKLVEFLLNDTDGNATFIVTRTEGPANGSVIHIFDSATGSNPPELILRTSVLSNDPAGSTIVGSDATSDRGAAVTVNADGSFIYNPGGSATLQGLDSGESAVDTFTYTYNDGSLNHAAVVSVLVSGVDGPEISVAATTPNAKEPSTGGQFTVSLSNPVGADIVVSYTVGGDATAGSDYTTLSGQVTILAGQTSATIDVAVLDDTLLESDETVTVTLTGVAGTPIATSFDFQEGVAPDGAYTTGGTYIRVLQPDTVLDGDPDSEVILGNASGEVRILLEFDLGSYADDAGAATLTLTSKGGGQGAPFTASLHAYDFDFDETTATWNSPAPGDSMAGGTLGTLLSTVAIDTAAVNGSTITFPSSNAFGAAVNKALAAGAQTVRLIVTSDATSGDFLRFRNDEFTGVLPHRPRLTLNPSEVVLGAAVSDTVTIASDTYDVWADANSLTGGDASHSADVETPTPDGLINLLEFAFGADPNASDNVSLVVTDPATFTPGQAVVVEIFDGGNPVRLRYVRRKDHVAAGLIYMPKFTDSTATLILDPATPAPSVVSTMAGDYEVVEVPFPLFDSTGKKATALIAVVEVTLN